MNNAKLLKKIAFVAAMADCSEYNAEETLWASKWNADAAIISILDAQ